MRKRLGFACEYELKTQTVFKEPRVRINSDSLDHKQLEWDETLAWNQLASYYTTTF
jgi:hypothetical protein